MTSASLCWQATQRMSAELANWCPVRSWTRWLPYLAPPGRERIQEFIDGTGLRGAVVDGEANTPSTWQAIDHADGLVRVGVQSAIAHPEAATLLRQLMVARGLPVPVEGRTLASICVTALCK
jgi:hypothetical protein